MRSTRFSLFGNRGSESARRTINDFDPVIIYEEANNEFSAYGILFMHSAKCARFVNGLSIGVTLNYFASFDRTIF